MSPIGDKGLYCGAMFAFTPLDHELLLGNHPATPADLRALAGAGVRAVVNLQSDRDLMERGLNWKLLGNAYLGLGIEARRVPIIDFDREDLARHLDTAVAAIAEQIAAGRPTFVHCNAGLNRSPSAVIAYVARHRGLSLAAAGEWVQSRHQSMPYDDVMRRWARKQGIPLE